MKWESVELGTVARTSSGGTPSRSVKDYWNGKIPWIKSGQLRDGLITECDEFITEAGLKSSSAKLVSRGTLLLALYGATAGKLAFTGIDAATNQAVCSINPDETLLCKRYLFYFLLSIRPKIIKDSSGGAQPNISQGYVQKIKVPLPLLHIQQQIADTLDKADALRQKDQQLLQKYDELAQSIFYDMFGDPMLNGKGWLMKPVIAFADCIVPGRDKPKTFTGSIPWVTTDDLIPLGITITSKKQMGLSPEEIKEVKAKVIPTNSVVMTCVGDLGIVSVTGKPIVINQQLHAFQCHRCMEPLFLSYVLAHQKPFMIKMASSTTVPYMNKTVCNSVPVICPPLAQQQKFSKQLFDISRQRQILAHAERKSVGLFTSLSSSYFNS